MNCVEIQYNCLNHYSTKRFDKGHYKHNTKIEQSTLSISQDLKDNLNKLNMIQNLKNNWDLHGAKPFNQHLIKLCRTLLIRLKWQPEIFPTANDSIQFEFENVDNCLEIQIFKDLKHMSYYMVKNGNEEKRVSLTQFYTVVNHFYE